MQFAALRYNSEVETLWRFLDSTSRQALIRRVEEIPYNGFGTLTGSALRFASRYFLDTELGHRPGVREIAIVLTDGKAQDNPRRDVQVGGDSEESLCFVQNQNALNSDSNTTKSKLKVNQI